MKIRALDTLHVGTADGTRTLYKGDVVDDDDPIVVDREHMFETVPEGHSKPARKTATKKSAPKKDEGTK